MSNRIDLSDGLNLRDLLYNDSARASYGRDIEHPYLTERNKEGVFTFFVRFPDRLIRQCGLNNNDRIMPVFKFPIVVFCKQPVSGWKIRKYAGCNAFVAFPRWETCPIRSLVKRRVQLEVIDGQDEGRIAVRIPAVEFGKETT